MYVESFFLFFFGRGGGEGGGGGGGWGGGWGGGGHKIWI